MSRKTKEFIMGLIIITIGMCIGFVMVKRIESVCKTLDNLNAIVTMQDEEIKYLKEIVHSEHPSHKLTKKK